MLVLPCPHQAAQLEESLQHPASKAPRMLTSLPVTAEGNHCLEVWDTHSLHRVTLGGTALLPDSITANHPCYTPAAHQRLPPTTAYLAPNCFMPMACGQTHLHPIFSH